MRNFVCDLGFSAVKWLYGDKRGRFTSAFQYEAGKLLIGDNALIGSGSSYLKTTDELVRYYPAFVSEAAKAAGIEGDTRLVVGLPYGVWRDEKDNEAGIFQALDGGLKKIGLFREVLILPQGLGGVKHYLENVDLPEGNILGIDIGFNTVIFTLYSPVQKEIIHGDTFYKRGVHQMATKHLLPTIKHLAPSRTFTPVEVSCLIEMGYLQFGFDRHDISREIENAAVNYIENVFRDINGELQAHLGIKTSFDTVVVFGGGARLLKDKIESKAIKVVIHPEPEYANALGFDIVARSLGEEENNEEAA